MGGQISPLELVYKQVDGVEVSLDVYIPPTATSARPAPIMLWWHALAPHLLAAPTEHNICVISPDYRLAPQTRMPGILEDGKSALEFIRTENFLHATGNRVDTSRIVLNGSSAGGWLSLLVGTGIGFEACGLSLPPQVQGIVAIYPITDLGDPFWKTKQRPVSYMDHIIGRSEVEPFISPDDVKATSATVDGKRSIFYHYMVQEALLSSLLLDGTNIPEEKFSVAKGLTTGTAASIPPVYIVTGNSDGKVPHRQSLDVVKALNEVGAEIHYEELDGLDHGFDWNEKCDMKDMYKFAVATLKP